MRTQVPDDADVGLVEPEVHAARGDEVELAEGVLVQHLADHPDRRAVEERVSAHERQTAIGGQLHELVRLVGRRRERLLDERVLAGFEAAGGQIEVCEDGSGDEDRVKSGVRQERVVFGRRPDTGVAAREPGEPGLVDIADPCHLDVLVLEQHAQQVRAPISKPDHAYAHQGFAPASVVIHLGTHYAETRGMTRTPARGWGIRTLVVLTVACQLSPRSDDRSRSPATKSRPLALALEPNAGVTVASPDQCDRAAIRDRQAAPSFRRARV